MDSLCGSDAKAIGNPWAENNVNREPLKQLLSSLYRNVENMAVRHEWSIKYRAAILERNPAVRLLRMTEASDAIQRRLGDLEETSDERRKLKNAVQALNVLRDRHAYPYFKSLGSFLRPLQTMECAALCLP